MAIDRTGISSLQSGAPEIKYTGAEGPKSPDQQLMAQADPMLVEMYQQYVFEMEEMGQQPISFKQFIQQAMSGMAYGGSAKPTYTQSRKQNLAYGGIAGIDGRKRYGIGSWFQEAKDKFVDDIIPNEIKENPMLSAAVAGGLLNQFGVVPGMGGPIGDFGKNWLGGLLSKVPGVPEGINTVLFDDVPFLPGTNQAINKELERYGYPNPDLDKLPKEDPWYKKLAQTIVPGGETGYMDLYGDTKIGEGENARTINWKTPLAIGMSMGALDKATRKDETLPAQQGIDIPAIRAAALRGEGNFLPPASATTAYANGGRTGYYAGERVEQDMIQAFSNYKELGGRESFDDWYSDIYLPETFERRRQGTTQDTAEADPWAKGAPYGFAEPGTRGTIDILSGSELRAQGGRIGYDNGGDVMMASYDYNDAMAEAFDAYERAIKDGIISPTMEFDEYLELMKDSKKETAPQGIMMAAQGGRIGYSHGGSHWYNPFSWFSGEDVEKKVLGEDTSNKLKKRRERLEQLKKELEGQAQGGRIGAQEGGLMDLGGMEKDYRNEGGFVPIGGQERADDVPARLSKNEFVFTADAVRSAGGGDFDKGAVIMENVMENLEQGGQISQESQGLEGARNMFATAQRLEGVL